MEQKICSKCEDEKLVTEFFFKNKRENKRHAQCKKCYRDSRKNKEHYETYKDEYKERVKKRKAVILAENRIALSEYMDTHHCTDCGEDNPIVLEFDHVRGSKLFGVSQMMSDYRWDQIMVEVNKCEVVCSNCHKIRTAEQFGWWKNKM